MGFLAQNRYGRRKYRGRSLSVSASQDPRKWFQAVLTGFPGVDGQSYDFLAGSSPVRS